MQKPIAMRGAVFAVLVLALCQVDGAAASSLRLHGRKLAQQPLPELIADSVASAATMSQVRWVDVQDKALTPITIAIDANYN